MNNKIRIIAIVTIMCTLIIGNFSYVYANQLAVAENDCIWELETPNIPSAADNTLISNMLDVSYYPQYKFMDEVKKAAEEKYKYQLKYFEQEINKSNLNVKVDIDSPEFRNLVFSYAFETPDGIELADFIKFIDLYENRDMNQLINEKVNEYITATETSDINKIESELRSLLPANNNISTQVEMDNNAMYNMSANALSNYSPSLAANYAKQWWNRTNNTGYPYYARQAGQSDSDNTMWDPVGSLEGKTRRGWNDCTNFVSQCLYAGGASQIGQESGPYSSTSWYYEDFLLSKPSYSWGGAQNFYSFWSWRVGVKSYASSVEVGDPISIDFSGDGSIDHTVIVTRLTSPGNYATAYITQHTSDKFEEKTLKNLYDNGYKIYIYDI